MDTHCKLLLYFDIRRILFDMKNECEKFLTDLNEKIIPKFPPFRFRLEIDIMDLIDCFPDLADQLLKEPLKWEMSCGDILFICMQSLENENSIHINRSQVAVVLRLKCIPSSIVKTNSNNYNGVASFDGILMSITSPESYVIHSVWTCPEECEGNEIILRYIPKVPPKCHICKSRLFENGGIRRCGEQVTATFKLNNRLLPKNLILVDDFIPMLKLGSRYIAHVVVLKKMTAVWGLEEEIPFIRPIISKIPDDIQNLYNKCKGSSWKFLYCLASSLGVNICPLNCFMHLKITLLLSLISVKAHSLSGSNIIHVLVASLDTRYVNAIMQETAKFADRHVNLGTSNSAVSTALIGSSGGVCVIPFPLHFYSQKQIMTLLSAVETTEISADNNKTKLKCAVWAEKTDYKKIVRENVASIVFGMVCRGDFGEQSDEIADFIQKRSTEHSNTSEEEIQAIKEIIRYMDIVAGIEVVLDKSAETLLKDYFLAARREVSSGTSVGSMGVLISVCMNIARLCKRKVTNTDDAVFAIWLHVCGGPEPRIAPEEYLETPADVKRLQAVITKFKVWLENFTGYSGL